MGKPSVPAAPTPPSQQEIADATIETAGHMARLQRAMEFGEELLKHKTNEDGSGVRYERVSTDIPEGFKPVYSDEDVKTSGPQKFNYEFKSPGGSPVQGSVNIDSDGNTEKAIFGIIQKHTDDRYPAGTHWSDIDPKLFADVPSSFSGSQPFTSKVKTLTGYESPEVGPDGKPIIVTANQYFKITTDKDGNLVSRSGVDRNEAIDVDFTGMGDIDRAMKRWEFEKKTSPEVADHLLKMARDKGLSEDGFIDTAVEMLERSDPIGAEVRKLAGTLARDYKPGELPTLEKLETLAGPQLLERIGVTPTLPEIAAGDVPAYERAKTLAEASKGWGYLDRLGAAPTLGELQRGEAPGLERAGEMGALRRAAAAPAFGEVGAAPGVERAGEMAGLGRIGAAPTLGELGAGPGLERAGEMAALERRGAAPTLMEMAGGPSLERAGELGALQRYEAFGGLERAGAMGDLERVGAMTPLERAGAAPDLEELTIDELALDPETMARRRYAEGQFAERAESGRTGRLMAEEARRIARGRAAASGNIFGGGAVIEEARAVRQAEDVGQRQAMGDYMGFLQSGQTAADYEAQISGENLRRRAMGIEQRGGARQAEFGMGMQRLGADRDAALQERADQLGGIAQRNESEEREYRAALQTLDTNRQAVLQEYGLEAQRRSFANEQSLRERSDQLAAIGQRSTAEQTEYENLQNQLTQINVSRQAQFGMGGEVLASNRQAQLQERADQLGAMGQRTAAEQQEYQNLQAQLSQTNIARQAQFGMEAQGLGINQQAQLAERGAEMEALGQRTGAQQQEYQNTLAQINQQNTARQAAFQADIQEAGFDNEAKMRERTDQLGAIAQRTSQQQQEFDNLSQIVNQINQTRGGQFGMQAQQLEVNTAQQLRERADELAALGQRNQAQEAEYQGLLAAVGQQAQVRQAQYGLGLQGAQQRNVAAESDFAREQAAMTQRNQAAQQAFAGAMQKTMSEEQLKQQQMANLQSFSGLAPVAGQFGALQGAGSGAGIVSPGVQYQPTSAMQLLQGQQQLAGSTFGTQANIFGTQAKLSMAPGPFEKIAGGIAKLGAGFGGSYGFAGAPAGG